MDREFAGLNLFRLENMIRRCAIPLFLLCAALLNTGCKNPLSEEKNKKLVHEAVFYDAPMGRYVYFWNGRDLQNRYVTPGKYYFVLEVKDFQDQDYVTAVEGGKQSDAESSYYYYNEIWHTNELGKIEPNPFPIMAGCTVTFILNGSAAAKLSIYQD
ncbi:MAG: hypothetical protein BWY77_00738 [bacterium ADurb.Bin431]|nr:MAG: hypothetical protein BWY77_00738 [bacterium ADurb.Bin431]